MREVTPFQPRESSGGDPVNARVVAQLLEAADLLEEQRADTFRIRAYRRGADAISTLNESVAEVYERGGFDALVALPGIGTALARAIVDVIEIGNWRWLERLRGETDPERAFQTIAGIGPGLAERIHHELHIDTLEDLEAAAYDGRLASLEGFGDKRVRGVRESLESRLRIRRRTRTREPWGALPPVEDLLEIDREYRRLAEQGTLPRIAPRRFNPSSARWLPILHTTRNGSRYTALYSNTARAHQLDRCRDWVVIYRDEPDDGQWTVVTETSGPQAGQRVVRGRERSK
ncbi:MAG: helix-hairpin-helix domain-containing protein [Acidimicrobiales bacterium]